MIVHFIDEIMVIGCDEKKVGKAQVTSIRYTEVKKKKIHRSQSRK